MLLSYKFRKKIGISLIVLLLLVISVIDLVPIYYMITSALKTRYEYLNNIIGLPISVTLENFRNILFKFNFPRMFVNSILITSMSVAIGVIVASLAAYAFGKMKFRGKEFMFNMMVPLMSIPAIVMFLPLFVLMKNVGLIDTYPAPIIIYVGVTLPFSIFLLTSFMDSVPNALLDMAKIDGCTRFATYRRIVMPLLSPAISTIIIINGMWIWNELLIAFVFLQSEAKQTLVVKLTSLQGLHDMNVPLVMAGAVIVSVPIIAVYIIAQRWFIRGLVQGSIK